MITIFRPINTATSEPVHAPVTGSGIATKSIKPNSSYFSTILLFFSALLVRKLKNPLKTGSFSSSFLTGFRKRSTGKTGIKLKKTAMKYIRKGFCFNTAIPMGIPPLSSKMGTIEIRPVTRRGDIPFSSREWAVCKALSPA